MTTNLVLRKTTTVIKVKVKAEFAFGLFVFGDLGMTRNNKGSIDPLTQIL